MLNEVKETSTTAAALSETPEAVETTRRKVRLSKSLIWGLILLISLTLMVTVAPMIIHIDPLAQDLSNRFAAPSLQHPLGTDNFGRDVFIRILVGGRIDIEIAVVATILSLVVGTTIGLWAGYFGGWVDTILMRLLDMTISFPMIVLVIAIVAMLGTGVLNMYIAIVIISWVYYARLTRGESMVVKNKEFIQAARALGSRDMKIILRHIFPNVVTGAIVYAASDAVLNIIFAGTLGYLGLGIQPPAPEWGSMVAESQGFLRNAPGLLIYPSIAIIIAGIAFSLIGDGLAETLHKGRTSAL